MGFIANGERWEADVIDFDLSEEQLALRTMAREFVEREVAPRVVEYNREGALPWDLVEKAGQLGLTGGVIPEEYGGAGLDYVSVAIIVEEVARVCTALAAVVAYPSALAGTGLLLWGTEEQKRRFLRPLAQGEILASTAITEPDCGSDAAALRCYARRDGDEYVLNGQKSWISNAAVAGWIQVFARMQGTKGKEGITAFIVERGTPGLSTRSIEHKLCSRITDTSDVSLDDCRVPVENRLGEEGQGWAILNGCVDVARITVAARSVGIAQGCLDASVGYANQRVAFGRPIAQFQLIQHMIAEMAVGVESARLLTWRAARERDKGARDTRYLSSLAKLHASRVAMKAAHDAIQIHGAYGVADEYHVERFFREAKMQEIVEGTSEIHELIVARHLLSGGG